MARRSTWVEPPGTQMMMRGLGFEHRNVGCTILMNCLSICSVTVKSAITPSFHRRMAVDVAGHLAQHGLFGLVADGLDGLLPLGPPSWRMATTEGSSRTMPLPRVDQVLAVPRSIARSVEM